MVFPVFGRPRMMVAMWREILVLSAIACQVSHRVDALELSLDVDVKVVPGGENTCGVLRCREGGDEPRVSRISSLTLFRRVPGSVRRGRTSIATVSERALIVSRLWDGVKVDGQWAEQRAELTLYLLEQDDCRVAEFSCEVRALDGLGEERVTSARLGKPGLTSGDAHPTPDTGSDHVASSALHLSALIQQSYSALGSAMRHLQSRLEDNTRDLENRLEDKVDAVEKALLRFDNSYNRDVGTAEGGLSDTSLEDLRGVVKNVSLLVSSFAGNVATLQNYVKKIEHDNSLFLSSVAARYPSQSESVMTNSISNCSTELRDLVAEAIVKASAGHKEATTGPGLGTQPSCERRERYHLATAEDGGKPYLCDSHTEDGGWIVIQRRSTGNVDFYRDWNSYKVGFGSLADDFWLGNQRIHALTSRQPYELMVNLKYDGKSAFAHYSTFSLEDEAANYTLRLGVYNGTAGDSLNRQRNYPFSTYDRDNDISSRDCARSYSGAWWYEKCHDSNLNGVWGALEYKGPRWARFSSDKPVTFSEMKIRRLH